MLLDIDRMPHDKNNYYRDLLRGSYNSYNDTQLFPSLCRDSSSGGGNYNSSSGGGGSSGNGGGRFNMLPSYLASDNGGGGYQQRSGYREVSTGGKYADEQAQPSRKRKLNISSDSSEDERDRRGSTGGSQHARKKNYCAPTAGDRSVSVNGSRGGGDYGGRSGFNDGSSSRSSGGGGVEHRIAPTLSGGPPSANSSEFDEKVAARKRRFGDVSR